MNRLDQRARARIARGGSKVKDKDPDAVLWEAKTLDF